MLRMGVDLGGTKIEIVALNSKGDELFRKRIPTPREYLATVNAIESLVNEVEASLGLTGTVGVGILVLFPLIQVWLKMLILRGLTVIH